MDMKAEIILQGADHAKKTLGKMKKAQALAAFAGIDWDALCREERPAKGAVGDYCPPGFCVNFSNTDGQTISLHIRCENASAPVFSWRETEKFEGLIRGYARRPPAQEKSGRCISRDQAAAAIEEFYQSLPDKGLRLAYHHGFYATTYRDFKNSLWVLSTIVFLCLSVVAGIGMYTLMRFPELQPEWFADLLRAQPWIESAYRSIENIFRG